MSKSVQRVAFTFSGLPGSGSTTGGKSFAKTLGLGVPHYSGGAARCLAEKEEEIGREALVAMYHDKKNGGRAQLRGMIAEMMVIGSVPARPNITAEYATFPPEFDYVIDEVQKDLLEQEHAAVHEGRMVPHLVRELQSEGRARDKLFLKIFFVADVEERIQRLQARDEYTGKSLEHIKTATEIRLATERERYRELYGVENHIAHEHFDIVLDTTHFTKEETLQELLRRIEELHPGLLAQFISEK